MASKIKINAPNQRIFWDKTATHLKRSPKVWVWAANHAGKNCKIHGTQSSATAPNWGKFKSGYMLTVPQTFRKTRRAQGHNFFPKQSHARFEALAKRTQCCQSKIRRSKHLQSVKWCWLLYSTMLDNVEFIWLRHYIYSVVLLVSGFSLFKNNISASVSPYYIDLP